MNFLIFKHLHLKRQKRHCRIVEIKTKTVHRKVLIHGPAGRRPDFCWGTTPDTGNQGTQIFLAFIGNIFMFPNFLYTHLLTINNDNCTECKVGCSAWQELELDSDNSMPVTQTRESKENRFWNTKQAPAAATGNETSQWMTLNNLQHRTMHKFIRVNCKQLNCLKFNFWLLVSHHS